MRVPLRVVLLVLVALAVAQPAAAAMWLRIQVGPAVAGTATPVTVTTLVMYDQLCIGDPSASPVPNGIWYSSGPTPSEPTFRLIAYPADRPDGAMPIALTHRAVDSPYWDGSVTFPSAGGWTVRMAQPNWGTAESELERCAGARIDVAVLPGPSERTPDALPFVFGVLILGLAVGLASRRLR